MCSWLTRFFVDSTSFKKLRHKLDTTAQALKYGLSWLKNGVPVSVCKSLHTYYNYKGHKPWHNVFDPHISRIEKMFCQKLSKISQLM